MYVVFVKFTNVILLLFLIHAGRREGMPRGVPNQRMMVDNRAKKISSRYLLTPADAVHLYQQNGGHLTEESNVGQDPLANDPQKCAIREAAFVSRYPSFDPMFHQIVNGNDHLFQEGLKYFIDMTYRLACTS